MKRFYGPSNTKRISQSVIRLISLQDAEKGKKTSVGYNGNEVIACTITKTESINDKWRMRQLKVTQQYFYLQHIDSGLYLSRHKNETTPVMVTLDKLQTLDDSDKLTLPTEYFGVFQLRGDDRGMCLVAPDSVFVDETSKYCTIGEGSGLIVSTKCSGDGDCKGGQTCKQIKDFCLGPNALKIKPNLRNNTDKKSNEQGYLSHMSGDNPISGNVYILLTDDDKILFGPPPISVSGQVFCNRSVQKGPKPGDWYVLTQQDMSNLGKTQPLRTNYSLGEFFSWTPDTDVNSVSVSREPLRERFIDKTTQIVKEQSEFPKLLCITESPDSVDCPNQEIESIFINTSTFHWQYIDIYAIFGGDQGYAPTELKNISIENMGLLGDKSKIGPGPTSGPPYMANVDNMYSYLDGKKPAGNGGRVTIPTKWTIDTCHKNGVKCYGCIFFQEIYYGGKWGWWVQFTQDPELSAQKMIDIAKYYNFDGWLFNFETGPMDDFLEYDYPGQEYKGINQLTGAPIDDYWCNTLSNTKYPAWSHSSNNEGGDPAFWPCSSLNNSGWPKPGFDPVTTLDCGSKQNGYKNGCNSGFTLRSNMKQVIKTFNKLRQAQNVDIKLAVYDTIQVTSPYGVGISTVDPEICPNGITNEGNCYGNLDFWVDEDGPVADYFYSMRSGGSVGGGIEPSASPLGSTSTYILSQSSDDIKENWPKDTGPSADGIFCPKADTTSLGKICDTTVDGVCGKGMRCVGENASANPSTRYCMPNLFSDYMCNYGKPLGDKSIKQKGRAYDYFQSLQLEHVGDKGNTDPKQQTALDLKLLLIDKTFGYSMENLAERLTLLTNSMQPQGWDSAIYCGSQSKNLSKLGYGSALGKCVNEEKAIEAPLASLNLFYVDTLSRWFDNYYNIPGYPNFQSVSDFIFNNQSVFWTGAKLLSLSNRLDTGTSADYWKGMAHYISEKSSITEFPFYTSFSLGSGTNFWIGGISQNYKPWNDWSFQSILPTWMWCPEDKFLDNASHIKINFDTENVYNISNSLCFSTIEVPSNWIRENPKPVSCTPNYPGSPQCAECSGPECGDKDTCLSHPTCCFDNSSDPDTTSWCFQKPQSQSKSLGSIMAEQNRSGPPNIIENQYNMKVQRPIIKNNKIFTTPGMNSQIDSEYRLYKTNLPLIDGCNLRVVCKGTTTKIGLSVILTLKSGKRITSSINVNKYWDTTTIEISPRDENIVMISLYVSLPFDSINKLYIGYLSLYKDESSSSAVESASYTQINNSIFWNPLDGVEYYLIKDKNNNKTVGLSYQSYQGKNISPDNRLTYYIDPTTSDVPISNLSIVPVYANQLRCKERNIYMYVLSIFFLLFLIYLVYRGEYRFKIPIIIILSLITLYCFIKLFSSTKCDSSNTRSSSNNYRVEHWQDCKEHCFNACFDDARVKCWSWLINQSKKKKWPVKFTFFYNTLWITRDGAMFKEWINMGHEIACHLHDHISCCDPTLSDHIIIENMKLNALLIRKLYNDPNRELLLAWPHGAFPLIAPNTCGQPNVDPDKCITCNSNNQNSGPAQGVPRLKVIKVLEHTFIAARSTFSESTNSASAPYSFFNNWPVPESLINYPNNLWGYSLSPIWGFPYQIDLNPSSDVNIPVICQSYMDLLQQALSIKNCMVIAAGHSFAPTDSDGVDVPCDYSSADQFGQTNCYNTDPSGNIPLPNDPKSCANVYSCPEDIAETSFSCYTNPKGSPIGLDKDSEGNFIIPDFLSSGMIAPTKVSQHIGFTGDNSGYIGCNQCCDACWNPTPGSCVIQLLDKVSSTPELYWFATYTEIVQYNFNRQNSSLKLVSSDGNVDTLELTCKRMYQCDITLSFGECDINTIYVGGDKMNILTDSLSSKKYIKFRPKSYTTHIIKVISN